MDTARFYSNRLKSKKVVTLSDVIDECNDSDRVREIVVIPPAAGDAGVDSDVDDIPEQVDDDAPYEAAGEYEIYESTSDDSDEGNNSESDDVPPIRRPRKSPAAKWKKDSKFSKELTETTFPSLAESFPALKNSSAITLWNMYFDQTMIESLVRESMKYAHTDKNKPDFVVGTDEIRRVIGIIILSGYHCLPQEEH